MDDRELYWRRIIPDRGGKDSPAFYTADVKGARTWAENYEPPRRDGRHEGKGPRGYRRPDLRILEDINEALTISPYVDASDVEVEVHMGVVTLAGRVDQTPSKHIAGEIAEGVSGVREVRNHIQVMNRHRYHREHLWFHRSPRLRE